MDSCGDALGDHQAADETAGLKADFGLAERTVRCRMLDADEGRAGEPGR